MCIRDSLIGHEAVVQNDADQHLEGGRGRNAAALGHVGRNVHIQTGQLGAALTERLKMCIRDSYRGVAEVSIYVGEQFRGHGLGCHLLAELCRQAEEAGYWTLQSTVLQDNAASRALHTKCGFRLVEMCIRDRVYTPAM